MGMIILVCWQQIGYMMIIYISGIQNIPGELIEAAKIDGANSRQVLRKVIIPMVMPSITICTFLTLTNGFKLFDQNLALTMVHLRKCQNFWHSISSIRSMEEPVMKVLVRRRQ